MIPETLWSVFFDGFLFEIIFTTVAVQISLPDYDHVVMFTIKKPACIFLQVSRIYVTLHNTSLPSRDQGRSSGERIVEAARKSGASTQEAGTPAIGLKGLVI